MIKNWFLNITQLAFFLTLAGPALILILNVHSLSTDKGSTAQAKRKREVTKRLIKSLYR